MASLKTSDDVEDILARYIPRPEEKIGKDSTVERMKLLMAAVGNPECKLAIIHIAGTSGKTSTAYYIAKMLHLSGQQVGLTVSPHIDDVTERIQINLTPLPKTEFKTALLEFIGLIEQVDIKPTYFELLVAFAYWYFAKSGVDYAVVETGIGGMYDSTNIASNPDKLCVITDIGRDHMHLLGDTLPEIARQKAGIIHSGNTALMLAQHESVMRVVKDWCQQHGAELVVLGKQQLETAEMSGLPEFQRRNWTLACAAYEWLSNRDGLPVLTEAELNQSAQIAIPARMNSVQLGGTTIIMDGAHNEQKMRAFVASFKKQYPGKRVPVLLSLKLGKAADSVLPILLPITSRLILTAYRQEQGLPMPPHDTGLLTKVAYDAGFQNVMIEPDSDRAFELLRQVAGDLAVITGSFYLIGQLRQSHAELH